MRLRRERIVDVDDVHVRLAGSGAESGRELRRIAELQRHLRARRLLEGGDMAGLDVVGERPSERTHHQLFRRRGDNEEGEADDCRRGRNDTKVGTHGFHSCFQDEDAPVARSERPFSPEASIAW